MGKQTKQAASSMAQSLTALAGALAIIVVGAAFAPDAQAQISSTRHNLSISGTGTVHADSAVDEICVFCHTPHGSNSAAAVPLWNRAFSSATYTLYDALGTSSLDGRVAPVGSVSIACLSCHDGTMALNAVLNAPGSGLAGDPARWPGTMIGTTGTNQMPAGAITNIGNDLRNDHPIGIQYAGGGYSVTNTGGLNVRDADFAVPTTAVVGTTQVWWVNSAGGTANREKSDMLLYTRTEAGAGFANVAEPFVECASCHDPHTNANPTFLRRSNVGSALCLTCHTK